MAPDKAKDEILRDENVALRIRVSTLESDVRLKDQEIAYLRRPKLGKRDPTAADAFQRPYRGR